MRSYGSCGFIVVLPAFYVVCVFVFCCVFVLLCFCGKEESLRATALSLFCSVLCTVWGVCCFCSVFAEPGIINMKVWALEFSRAEGLGVRFIEIADRV